MTLSGQNYACSAGETWDGIALEVYGDEKYACELLNANPSLSDRLIFAGGEELELPVVEISEYEDDEDADAGAYMPATAPWKE